MDDKLILVITSEWIKMIAKKIWLLLVKNQPIKISSKYPKFLSQRIIFLPAYYRLAEVKRSSRIEYLIGEEPLVVSICYHTEKKYF